MINVGDYITFYYETPETFFIKGVSYNIENDSVSLWLTDTNGHSRSYTFYYKGEIPYDAEIKLNSKTTIKFWRKK